MQVAKINKEGAPVDVQDCPRSLPTMSNVHLLAAKDPASFYQKTGMAVVVDGEKPIFNEVGQRLTSSLSFDGEHTVNRTWTAEDWGDEDWQAWRGTLKNGPVQFRRALREAGLTQTVNDYLATLSADEQEDFAVATEIKRLDPFITDAQAALGITDEQADAMFLRGLALA